MKTLTKKTRNILIGSGAGLLAAAAVAIGIWQPWKKAEKPQDPPPQQQEVVKPQEPEKKGPSLLVGGEEIPCTIHEGDGWSILVPEGWTTDAGKNHGIFTAPGEQDRAPRVEVSCGTPGSGDGRYTFLLRQDLSPEEEWRLLCFHDGGEKSTWEVTCQADVEEWDSQVNLLTAVARSFKLGNEQIFSRTAQANEPDWQEAEGKTVLWLDKDGLVLDDPAEEAVRAKMKSWSQEQRAPFNGKYEFDAPRWMGSYCFGQGQYRDVFTSMVRYGLNEDAGEQILDFETLPEDGWIADPQQLTLVVDHQGDAGAAKVKPQWQDGAAKAAAGETIALEEIGVTLVLPESWKGKCTVAEDKDGYVVYSPEIKKAFGGSEEDLFDGGMVCYIRRIDEVLTEEEIKDSEWDFAPNRYVGAGKDCTYLLYQASDVQFPPELQEEYQKFRDGIGEIQIRQDPK